MMYLAILRFAQPWHRQSRKLIRLKEGYRLDKWIGELLGLEAYLVDKHLAVYRRMKELGIMTEKDFRFMSGEEK